MASSFLPPEVVTCLQNARYLHLATSDGLWPHVSLMNYTYLPAPSPTHPIPTCTSGPIIILPLAPLSQKTTNLLSNPRVSLLVHDWVSHRPSGGSALADMLSNINTAALSSISATLFGYATVLEAGGECERYYKGLLEREAAGAGESGAYLEGDEKRVVAVRVVRARVADFRGGVTDWWAQGEEGMDGHGSGSGGSVNGMNGVNGV